MELNEYSYGIILYKKNSSLKFLLLKRSEGWLDFPKGHIEKNETEIEAAIRETFEETGIKINPDDIDRKFSYSMCYKFQRGNDMVIKHVKMFLSKINDNASIRISAEHSGYIWLDYNDCMKNLSHENQREMIKNVYEYLNIRK